MLHPSDSDYEKRLRNTLKREAAELGVELITRRTRSRRMSAEGAGARRINILEPADANELYRDLSLRKCYVLSRGSVFVLYDPRRDPPAKRDCFPLQRFVEHKAVYRTFEDGVDAAAELRRMMATGMPSDCVSYHDPRVLPLHVFDRKADGSKLDTEDGRSAFHWTYAIRGSWLSAVTGTWRPAAAGARHGLAGPSGEALRVWDFMLPMGYHWDANAGRQRRTIVATACVWRVEQRGYVNIYPDSHIRSGAGAKRGMAGSARFQVAAFLMQMANAPGITGAFKLRGEHSIQQRLLAGDANGR